MTDRPFAPKTMNITENRKRSGYRCFLYDAAVLIAARKKLEISPRSLRGFDIGTGDDQFAIEAALCKVRSLYDFFTGPPGQRKEDDLCSWEFCFGRKYLDSDQREFRDSIHKYAMHLTWERVDREKRALPRIPVIVIRAQEIEAWIREFISCCDAQGLKPDNSRGARYLQFVRDNVT